MVPGQPAGELCAQVADDVTEKIAVTMTSN